MKGPVPVAEERLVLFCEDSSYSLKQLSSIIKEDDYLDLGITLLRPWERPASSTWHKYVSLSPFLVPSYCCLALNLVSISCRGWS